MQTESKRIHLLDTLRGILIIYVVIYHLLYDMHAFTTLDFSFIFSKESTIIREILVGILIVISGISCNLSRNNTKRGIKTLGIGVAISILTYLIMPSEFIVFGILHMFGCAMMLAGIGHNFCFIKNRWLGVILSGIGFILTKNLYNITASSDVFLIKYILFILGFNTGVYSADYYPIMPWVFLFTLGVFLGRNIKYMKLPSLCYRDILPVISLLGRHTLLIYVLHQPIILAVLNVLVYFRGH